MRPIATDTHDTKLFFMSRPRRFGKFLTVSALKALFSARRDPIWLIGLSFDSKTRHLVDYAAERF